MELSVSSLGAPNGHGLHVKGSGPANPSSMVFILHCDFNSDLGYPSSLLLLCLLTSLPEDHLF